jgi:DNA invertase Pin-like site-specific DNA recombinase
METLRAMTFAEYERCMIRERIKAGLQRARAQGKRLGRAKVPDDVDRAVRASLAAGTGILKTARTIGVGKRSLFTIGGNHQPAAASYSLQEVLARSAVSVSSQ